MRIKQLFILILTFLVCSCDKTGLKQVDLQGPSEWTTAKIAVVLPLSGEDSDKGRYERISKMFEENTIKAQFNLTEGVKLELEWFDENSLDIKKFANELYYRDDIVALIGPLRNEHVDIVANIIYNKGIPMFVMTSSEDLVRRYSSGSAGILVKEPFMWSLSVTDIVQAHIILSKAGSMGYKRISLISANNDYGNTFNKWIPHYAGEMDLKILDKVQYSGMQELEDKFASICNSEAEVVICALNDADEAKTVLKIANNNPVAPKIYFTGSALTSSLLKQGTITEGAEGFSMYPSPYTGFHKAYQTRFGELPMLIDAQLYDSFLCSLISFARYHYSGGKISMNEAMAELSDLALTKEEGLHQSLFWEQGTPVWDYAALGEAVLKPIRKGQLPELSVVGTMGNLKFASESYTSLVKGIYISWMIHNGKPIPLDFIDEGGHKYSSYIFGYDWKRFMEEIENESEDEISIHFGNKAVLICGSEGWYNYRHQADLLYVYNTLKKGHFSDDDIILIMRDDIAFHPKNPHQGVVKVSPKGENLYRDVVIDYRADTLTTRDIEDILLGNKSERLPNVLESADSVNVLLYWTGHGKNKSFTWMESGEKFTDEQLGATVRKMYEKKMYKSMLICAEPCFSGSVVQAIEGTPLVLGFAAASDSESSYADNFDSELGVWMRDRFTYNLMRIYENFMYSNLLDVYKELNTSTLGSHVQVFNTDEFYNLKDCILWDYFYNYNYNH